MGANKLMVMEADCNTFLGKATTLSSFSVQVEQSCWPVAPSCAAPPQGRVLFSAGLEELVLSEISSPSRSQPTGDSSSISSFSYKDMMKETQTTTQSKVSEAGRSRLLRRTFSSFLLAVLPSLKFWLLF